MKDILYEAYSLIINYIFSGFAVYSLFLVIYRFFNPYDKVKHFDGTACSIISLAGIVLFIVFASGTYTSLADQQNYEAYANRMFGPYWFFYWFEPLAYLLFSQLLWSHRFRRNVWFRVLLCLLFFMPFEHFVIIVTSLHRDFLPGGWGIAPDTSLWWLGFAYLLKGVEFTALVALLHFSYEKIKRLQNNRMGIL